MATFIHSALPRRPPDYLVTENSVTLSGTIAATALILPLRWRARETHHVEIPQETQDLNHFLWPEPGHFILRQTRRAILLLPCHGSQV